jgi:hypothetical protein
MPDILPLPSADQNGAGRPVPRRPAERRLALPTSGNDRLVAESRNRQWRILAVVLTGSFMAVLDSTVTALQRQRCRSQT